MRSNRLRSTGTPNGGWYRAAKEGLWRPIWTKLSWRLLNFAPEIKPLARKKERTDTSPLGCYTSLEIVNEIHLRRKLFIFCKCAGGGMGPVVCSCRLVRDNENVDTRISGALTTHLDTS
jgi:hypothetical protein